MKPKAAAALLACALLISAAGCSDSGSSSEAASTVSEAAEPRMLSAPGGTVASAAAERLSAEFDLKTLKILSKTENNQSNPLVTNMFCADPTAIEYNGRLYVYGTNDEQQYKIKGDAENTYEKINSLVILSTDDMVNWRYEGKIETKSVAKWITASWAPSIVSRMEDDGLTHFYLYFSNSGGGVGVLTSTDPVGPWEDPLKKPFITAGTKGLKGVPIPFDPGACIDDDGVGWLAFGGGEGKSEYQPGVARIVRLGSDMLSFDSDFIQVDCPYFFEASELNFIGGQYVYTFNTSWKERKEWDSSLSVKAPPICSMAYMKTATPLEAGSWEYQDYYLKNPGELGMNYGNNHTHLQKFGDKYYLFFHAAILNKARGIQSGYRSICVAEAQVDEENAVISNCKASKTGVPQLKALDPFLVHEAEECFLTNCEYGDEIGAIYAKCDSSKLIAVKGAAMDGCKSFAARVRGKGTVEVRTGDQNGEKLTAVTFDCSDWTVMTADASASGEQDLFFVFDGDFDLDSWQFS
ncbi:MAG: family 43 glycosylhydrolase [Ruminococcus sp.]|nr:family 43 glycosylhydrolase [Ruminococcus sp.]